MVLPLELERLTTEFKVYGKSYHGEIGDSNKELSNFWNILLSALQPKPVKPICMIRPALYSHVIVFAFVI